MTTSSERDRGHDTRRTKADDDAPGSGTPDPDLSAGPCAVCGAGPERIEPPGRCASCGADADRRRG